VAAVPGRHPHASEPIGVRLCGLALAVQGQATPAKIKKDAMQFFLALGILIAASSAYLLHQFWSRSLSSTDDAPPSDSGSLDSEPQPSRLKAA
jgi:hypothetical protein